MNNSTQKFIQRMQAEFGEAELVGRGNILNFGGKVTFAVRYSSESKPGRFWFAVQPDFLTASNLKPHSAPLGLYPGLVCGSENAVVVIPQRPIADE